MSNACKERFDKTLQTQSGPRSSHSCDSDGYGISIKKTAFLNSVGICNHHQSNPGSIFRIVQFRSRNVLLLTLSEFERGLIIGIKTAVWSTRHVAALVRSVPLEIVGSSGHGTRARKTGSGATKEDHEERGSKDRATSTCGPHSDSFNDTSRRRRSNCSTNNFQTP
ncbi:hypothetical protein TNCV_2983531 [Trichonephila clavipes]|nr:hypothetical protein TNCV_2983531 [Trichonephila clavipes]